MRNRYQLQKEDSFPDEKSPPSRTKTVKKKRKWIIGLILSFAVATFGSWAILSPSDGLNTRSSIPDRSSPVVEVDPEEPDPTTIPGSEDWWDPGDPSNHTKKPSIKRKKDSDPLPPTISSQSILHNNWRNPDRNRHSAAIPNADKSLPPTQGISDPTEQQAPFEKPPNKRIQIAARFPYWDPTAVDRLEQAGDQIDELNYPWYDVQSDGTLALRSAEEARQVLSTAEKNEIRVLPVIGNQYSPTLLHEVLNQPEKQDKLKQEIIRAVLDHGYAGVELQFEPIREEDREAYSRFAGELSKMLHEKKRWLSVALHPKTPTEEDYPAQRAQDWKRLGKVADSIKIMVYHYNLEKPGPSAPLPWLEKVLDQAKAEIPNEKLYISLSAQGYIWTGPNQLAPLSFEHAQGLIQSHGLTPHRTEGEPWFRFSSGKQTVTGYYQDAAGYGQKMCFLLKHHPDLAGIAHWYLGDEDPETWKAIREANNKETDR